jgi:pyrroloquinoline quinone (PQQ) biosynthesis protein C
MPPAQRMTRCSIGMRKAQWENLRRLAEAAGVSRDEVLRRFVDGLGGFGVPNQPKN